MMPIRILLVEDNPGDIELTVEAFKEGKITNEIEIVNDGQAAMDCLRNTGEYVQSKRPDIILLDLNLPKKDGRQVLQEIKNDPHLKRIPVVILTTSAGQEDILKAYDNHANCYIRKPVDLNNFMEVIRKIESFWLTIVKLPSVP